MYAQKIRALFPALVATLLVLILPAQTFVPQSYTLSMTSRMALEAMTADSSAEISLSRFGPREFVDVTVTPKSAQAKPVHTRHWFDLAAHKAYTLDVAKNTCSWMSYTVLAMPAMYDPPATPAPSADDLAAFNKHFVRAENVNGIAARMAELPGDMGITRVWAALNGNYPLKAEILVPGSAPLLIQEVKSLRFEKPDLALLAPPAGCTTQAQGEWTADGISAHGKSTIEVEGSGHTDLNTGKTTGDATVKSGGK